MLARMDLVAPAAPYLASYVAACEQGWANERAALDPAAAAGELAEIHAGPEAFLAALNHPTRLDQPVVLPDGTTVPRLPGVRRWMWDGDYCGAISLRWQPGSTELPPYCLGHVGYAVVPWKRRRGYATDALAQMLPIARDHGLAGIDIVTDITNTASASVVQACGGVLVREYVVPEESGGFTAHQWRIAL